MQPLPIRGPYAHEIPPDPFTRGPYAQGNTFGAQDLSAKGLLLMPWVVSGATAVLEIDNTAITDGELQMQFYYDVGDGKVTVNLRVPFVATDTGLIVATALKEALEAAYPVTCTVSGTTTGSIEIALQEAGTIYAPPFVSIA